MSARRKRVISTEEIQFNHKPPKFYWPKKEVSQPKWPNPKYNWDLLILCTRASKTFVLFVLCTEAETGYFGGRQAVKGGESQYSLTEALCLFWVPPWGLHLSPVTNIHIIDRVLYCRMAFLSPIIDNWLWKWYRGIQKKFSSYFFFCRYFSLILCICFTICMKCMNVFMWQS